MKFEHENHCEIAYLSPFENEVSLRTTNELAGWSSSPTKLSARRTRERVIFRSGSRDDDDVVDEDDDNDDGPPLPPPPPPLPLAVVTAFSVASRSSSSGVASRKFCSLDATFGTSFRVVPVDIFAHET